MADLAHSITDKELEKMERHLSAIYARAEKEIGATWKNYLEEVAKELRPLQDAYDAAKKSGDADATRKAGKKLAAKQREKTIMNKHYKAMTGQLAQELSNVNKTAQDYINGRLPSVYTLNYNRTAEGVSAAVKGYSFELVDASTVKNLVTSDKTLLPYKYVDGKKDVRWNTTKINSEVLQGILQGESIPNIAKRLQNVTEMNLASAIRNARTTVTSAENKGRMDMLHDAADKGVITHKVWKAAIDARTREAHRLLDGQEQEIDDPFESIDGDIMFPGDPEASPEMVYNCRCTLTYKVVGFGASEDAKNIDGELITYSDKLDDEKWNESKSIINGLTEEYNTKLQEVRPGAHQSAGSVQISGTVMNLSSTAPEVAIHEFAHTISMENQTKFGLYDEPNFWKEIKRVQRQYRKNVGDDVTRWISTYEHGSKNTDEFMAEAFAQAKMAEMGIELPNKYGSDLTYSRLVLEIIDKYFKKRR